MIKKRKILLYALVFIGTVVLTIAILYVLSFLLPNKSSGPQPTPTPEIEELMSIIKKSPDYPDFLKIIKSNDFDAELVDYYNFSPEVYNKKMGEWEADSNSEMKDFRQVFETIQLNDNSFLVEFKSKSNPEQGLLAILDMKKKEPQLLVATLKIEAGVGL